MTFLQWNCRGYRRNYGDVRYLLNRSEPLFFVLQETMLGDYIPPPPNNYSIICHSISPDPRPGTGLSTLIRKDVSFRRLALNTPLQALATIVNVNNRQLTVCNLYMSPGEDVTIASLTNLADQLPRPALLLGDMNGKSPVWGNNVCDVRGRILEQFLTTTDLCLLNNGQHTYFHSHTASSSALDLSFCSPEVLPDVTWTVMDDLCGSDHFPIVMEFLAFVRYEREPRFIIRRANWETFHAASRMDETVDNIPVEELLERMTSCIKTASNIAIPRAQGGSETHRVPWWTDECTKTHYERKRAFRRYQRTHALVDKISFHRARARDLFIKKKSRRESRRRYAESLNADLSTDKLFKRVKKMDGRSRDHVPCLLQAGQTITNPQDVADVFSRRFADISSGHHYPPHFNQTRQQLERRHLDFRSDNQETYNAPITYLELKSAMQKSGNTAPGPDGIHYKMLKNLHPTALQNLLFLFNKIWSTHHYPEPWRMATILPLRKPGKPPEDPSSYRPIALTSCMGKLLERIVKTRLMRILEAESVLSPMQYGFRRFCSTTDALVRLQNFLVEGKRAGRHSVCVFFDLHRAYDTIWRWGILRSLHEAGLRGNLAMYVQQFLSRRYFKVKVGDNLSDVETQVEGVPQGSVLSCSLFLLALNGILSTIPAGVFSSLYVDDLMICASSAYLPALTRRLQGTITMLSDWALNRGFVFFADKTVALHVQPGRVREANPHLVLMGQPVTFAISARFLGLTFDDKLSWKPHINALRVSCNRKLNILKCVAGKTWGGRSPSAPSYLSSTHQMQN